MPPANRLQMSKAPRRSVAKKFQRPKESITQHPLDHMPTLNDDCLREIFAYLSIIDLCATKDCCRRFSRLVEEAVRKRWRNQPKYIPFGDFSTPRAKLANCISWLEIVPGSYSDGTIFTANLKRFAALKALTLRLVDISFVSHELEVLQNIEKLELIGCTNNVKDYDKMLKACKKLKHLTVRLAQGTSTALIESINRHVYIESVSWILDIHTGELSEDLGNLQQLEHLKRLIVFFRNFEYPPRIGNTFAAIDTMNLEKLEIHLNYSIQHNYFLREFNKFTTLKWCELRTREKLTNANVAFAPKFNFKLENVYRSNYFGHVYTVTPNRK